MNKLKKYKSGSKIEWTEETWNPVVGCHKISDGCKNCYAEKMHKRHYANPQQPKYTKPFNEVFYDVNELKKPFNWNKPKVIFVCSMSDLFNKRKVILANEYTKIPILIPGRLPIRLPGVPS